MRWRSTARIYTRLSVSRGPERTRVAVLDGEIRITRLSDQRVVELAPGQATEVSSRADLRPTSIQAAPDHWSLDFNDGLPHGWQTGQLVAFLLVFDSPEQNPGLTIDRIWVTRGEPAEPRSSSELYEDRTLDETE